MSVVGLVVVCLVAILGVFEPIIAPFPTHVGAYVNFKEASIPPNTTYWMGTDVFGRDIMSRIFYAFRGALTMGIGVLVVVVPLGGILGLIAGYWKGNWISTLIMRVTAVSYTHLRAHETRHDLVCRLLLEKKKNKSWFIKLQISS